MLGSLLAECLWATEVQAQSTVEVQNNQPTYTFGEEIKFSADITTDHPISESLVFLQPEGDDQTYVSQGIVDPDGKINFLLNLHESPLRAFCKIHYWYKLAFQNGETYTSPDYSFYYYDNRFSWVTYDQPPFSIQTIGNDGEIFESIINSATTGLKDVQEKLGAYPPDNINIYVYQNTDQMQSALTGSSKKWLAGHADPDLGVILVSIPPGPGQQLEIERQIPHELAHVMMYYTDAHTYANLPAWLNEGLASLVELYPDPDYPGLLQNAYETGALLPIATLCQDFPADTQSARLAYAESASFTNYLYGQFGTTGINRLMAAYAGGIECQLAVRKALGTDLPLMEGRWRQAEFSQQAVQTTLYEYLPWIILLGVILVGPLLLMVLIMRRKSSRVEL